MGESRYRQWEPCESRGSRTVLREAPGEIPGAYSLRGDRRSIRLGRRHVTTNFLWKIDLSPLGSREFHSFGTSQYKLFHFSFIKVSMHSCSGVTSILSAKA